MNTLVMIFALQNFYDQKTLSFMFLHTWHQTLNPNVTNNAAVKVIAHMNTQTITSTNAERKLESRPL